MRRFLGARLNNIALAAFVDARSPAFAAATPMTAPRFQFTIRGLLWATFWVAAWGACWVSYQQGGRLSPLALLGVTALPFAACGALFGDARSGLMLGGIVSMLLLIFLFLLILSGTGQHILGF